MDPFSYVGGYNRTNKEIRAIAKHFKLPFKTVKEGLQVQDAGAELWINSTYQVDKRSVACVPGFPDLIWLSIKRRDREPVGDERFRDFQAIKNHLVGAETEAVELYPAESRLVDTANQYHLWCTRQKFPFGFPNRNVDYRSGGGAKQKPL